jgi:Flp pilus assembly protein TadD
LDYRSLVERAVGTLRAGDLHGAVLALIALQTARPDLALERARRAHELDRKHTDYLGTMGLARAEHGDLAGAEATLRRALKSRPDSAELNLGRTLYKQGRPVDRRACGIDPRHPGALNNHAAVLFELGRAAEARRVLEQAVATEPRDEMALDNLATVVFRTEGPRAVCAMFGEHLARYPGLHQARLSYAMTLLAAGDIGEGWRQYRLCARSRDASDVDPIERLPEDLRGRTVLLRMEQGLGDVLFFLRFVPRLRERGARVILESPAKLAPVLSGHGTFERVIAHAGPGRPPGFDIAVHLGDLPALVDGAPAGAHFALAPDGTRTAETRRILAGTGPAPYLGLTWRAGTAKRDGFMLAAGQSLFKEVPLAEVARALSGVAGTVVVVQRDPAPGELQQLQEALGRTVCDLSRLNDDPPQMVALLDVIDEYVGVSNTNMHLREAVGKTARVLVPYPAEWRWMFEGSSPWFPGFGVYRQAPGKDWSEALRRLRADMLGPLENP